MTADFLFWLLAVIAWFIGAIAGWAGNAPDANNPTGVRFWGINWLCLGLAFAGITVLVG